MEEKDHKAFERMMMKQEKERQAKANEDTLRQIFADAGYEVKG